MDPTLPKSKPTNYKFICTFNTTKRIMGKSNGVNYIYKNGYEKDLRSAIRTQSIIAIQIQILK